MPRVLLITKGIEHPTYTCRASLIQTLNKINGISYTHISSLENLPGDLKHFDGMVLYFHEQLVSDTALILFAQFVDDGGGVLAIHSASASFMDSSVYFEIIGGRFKHHGRIKKFMVRPVAGTNVFNRIPPFTVEDELYIHDLQPGIIPHFTALEDKEEIPMVWTHFFGKGRVCYAVPGHRPETMYHPDYQNLLKQGLSWTMGTYSQVAYDPA